MLPPPALTSARSMTGTRIGCPVPCSQRLRRAAADLVLGRDRDLAAGDHARLGRRSAHVERDQVWPARVARPASGPRRPRRPGRSRPTIAGIRSASAISTMPPLDPMTYSVGKPSREAALLQPVEIGGQQRPDIGADRGRAGAFELADFRQDVAGQDRPRPPAAPRAALAEAPFMRVVEEREQQRDRDRLQPGVADRGDQRRRSRPRPAASRSRPAHRSAR